MEKPLHVRVAEALGWTEARCLGNRDSWDALAPLGPPHGYRDGEPYWLHLGRVSQRVPRYDRDWSATGPLIEQQRIAAIPWTGMRWRALRMPLLGRNDEVYVSEDSDAAFGPTPLIAACNLILALHAAGKLTDAHSVPQLLAVERR